ncbi:MAG TPA: hypothetical protein VGU24_04720 [Microvirga sp.]|jgi:hypothetical protein|nr:hypothetical protein [Microvirga sp.]
MTAEVAIMNRQGIALAADSAVTIGRARVWKSANKLFSMAPFNDIAIMAFGSGDFIGHPWETVVKSFRLTVGTKRFSRVQDCADAFLKYLEGSTFGASVEEAVSVLVVFVHELERISKSLGDYESKKEFRTLLAHRIDAERERLEKVPENGVSLSLAEFRNKYSKIIGDLSKDAFKSHIPQSLCAGLVEMCYETFGRTIKSDYYTGIVIAGFGTDEYFPNLINYVVDGKDEGVLRAWKDEAKSHNLNEPDVSPAVIIPFAQSDIAVLFLEGIARSHMRWIRSSLKSLLDNKSDTLITSYVSDGNEKIVERTPQRKENSKIVRELEEEFRSYRDASVVQPIMKVIASLPKEEMAHMAEALVELTSLRRRVDSSLETVGGPTDVAVVSKGDGLIWLKRKHYFKGELNPDYTVRKQMQFRGGEDGQP